MRTPDDLMCEVCNRPLDVLTDEEGVIKDYWHASGISIGATHDPVPVVRVESAAILICDFCSTPGGMWRYPARTFDGAAGPADVASLKERAFVTSRSVGDWMACDVCHSDILANRWDAIASRGVRGAPRAMRPEFKRHIRILHQQFRKNRTGDPIPVRSRP